MAGATVPRKRVAVACIICRQRKRRCDAKRPSCRGCIDAGAECKYEELPVQRFNSVGGSRAILGRLREIEAVLKERLPPASNQPKNESISSVIEDGSGKSTSPVFPLQLPGPPYATSPDTTQALLQPPLDLGFEAPNTFLDFPPLTIPSNHRTSVDYLLHLPEVQSLLGDYPTDLFLTLESRNQILQGSTPHSHDNDLTRNRERLDYLVEIYFSEPNNLNPVLNRSDFQALYETFLQNGPDSTIDSALCLAVLAVGAAASESCGSANLEQTPPGIEYIEAALPTLTRKSFMSFSGDIRLCQALILTSIYFAYIVRPLQSWRFAYEASTMVYFKLSRQQTLPPETRESFLRVFWACFTIECDRLAELELPQSGIQMIVDEIDLPNCHDLNSYCSTMYLAQISVRRLLNRVHSVLYSRDTSLGRTLLMTDMNMQEISAEELLSHAPVFDELNRQLHEWYDSIPQQHRPSLVATPSGNDHSTGLKIRYYAALHIIYRPFLLCAIKQKSTSVEPAIMEKSEICIESCRNWLRSAAGSMQSQGPSIWSQSLSCIACIILLTLASRSQSLRHLEPDIGELQSLAVGNMKWWSYPGSSLEAVLSIVQDLQAKQRMFGRIS